MPKSLTKSRLHNIKQKPKIKPEGKNIKTNLSPNLQPMKQKLLSGSVFKYINES